MQFSNKGILVLRVENQKLNSVHYSVERPGREVVFNVGLEVGAGQGGIEQAVADGAGLLLMHVSQVLLQVWHHFGAQDAGMPGLRNRLGSSGQSRLSACFRHLNGYEVTIMLSSFCLSRPR